MFVLVIVILALFVVGGSLMMYRTTSRYPKSQGVTFGFFTIIAASLIAMFVVIANNNMLFS